MVKDAKRIILSILVCIPFAQMALSSASADDARNRARLNIKSRQVDRQQVLQLVDLAKQGWYFFEPDSFIPAVMPAAVEEQYESFVKERISGNGLGIEITGYAEPRYSVDYGLALGEQRARTLCTYLSKRFGISVKRIHTRSLGNAVEVPKIGEFFAGARIRMIGQAGMK